MLVPLKRITHFVRSVLPTDPSQLLFLSGCFLLYISFQLRWWPAEVANSIRHVGPMTLYTSSDPVLIAANAWIPIYWWCSLVLFVCGAGGLFIALWPGTRPLRFVFLFVWFPCSIALAIVCSRFLYLAKDITFPMLDSNFLTRPHNISWAIQALWQLGPGFHVSLTGFLLVSIFLSRMTLGLTSLPVSLAESLVQSSEDAEQWARIWLFIIFSCTFLFLVRMAGGLPLIGIFFLGRHIDLMDAQGKIVPQARWILYVLGPLDVAIISGAAAWSVGKDRWKSLGQFLKPPSMKYGILAILFPVGLGCFVPFLAYTQARISWAIHDFGRFFAPSLRSYFTVPAATALANWMPASFFEEIAWRGFLLPRFVARYGMYRGVFFVSIVWGAYHLQADFSSHSSDVSVVSQVF
jgi:membrane protease YdiL (CAAX protease family)